MHFATYIYISESELVSGFMTEHSAVIFVFFFLAEYASLVLMCILITILFLGGYNFDVNLVNYLIDTIYWNSVDAGILFVELSKLLWNYIDSIYYGFEVIDVQAIRTENFNTLLGIVPEDTNIMDESLHIDKYLINPLTANLIYAFVLGFKSLIMIFIFIWVRASFPRIRFDQLMSFCWTVLLPLVFAFVILIPCVLYSFEMFPVNVLFF